MIFDNSPPPPYFFKRFRQSLTITDTFYDYKQQFTQRNNSSLCNNAKLSYRGRSEKVNRTLKSVVNLEIVY